MCFFQVVATATVPIWHVEYHRLIMYGMSHFHILWVIARWLKYVWSMFHVLDITNMIGRVSMLFPQDKTFAPSSVLTTVFSLKMHIYNHAFAPASVKESWRIRVNESLLTQNKHILHITKYGGMKHNLTQMYCYVACRCPVSSLCN